MAVQHSNYTTSVEQRLLKITMNLLQRGDKYFENFQENLISNCELRSLLDRLNTQNHHLSEYRVPP